jgi:hypothetical protein
LKTESSLVEVDHLDRNKQSKKLARAALPGMVKQVGRRLIR